MKNSILAALLFGSTACAGFGVKTYVAAEVTAFNVPDRVLLEAARQVVVEHGWRVIELNLHTRTLEAITEAQEIDGALTRERWWFTLAADGMNVSKRMEVQWDVGAPWEWADVVCNNYQYLSERTMVENIHRRITGRASAASVADVWVLTASR